MSTTPAPLGIGGLMLLLSRWAGVLLALIFPLLALAQTGDAQVRTKADALFEQGRYGEALNLYSQLVSLQPGDRDLNYRFGTCLLFGGDDKDKAVGHLKFATEDPGITPQAWYWLGRAYHFSYRFKEAQVAYQRYKGIADKKLLADLPVDALEQQCRNGQKLLANLKEITVRSKVEVDAREFFRFYDLSDIGGRIVVTPEELKTSLDKKSDLRSLVYLPDRGGPIYFSSYGKDGRTGLDIYRSELLPDGRFATAIKLAGFINTDEDDDYPFMHPDGKAFYFSSRGHNSMGGFDVFKAVYDKGLDVFGRPENMDFAVNTPDDDIFYMVDAEHREACFASGRSSKQGKLHVYRVGTEQMPLLITVLKGTYASEFDADDRKARIVVEDAITREQVADVRTDMNGNYVLALPRSGRFRFLVDCGPSGRTHLGLVEIPRSDGPRGYRQELALVRHGDQEKLLIRNYFDSPLDDDLIALAMDEIRRRARLDVTGERAVAQVPAPQGSQSADVLTRAGFTGDMTKARAFELAQDDARDLDRQVQGLKEQRRDAYAMTMEAVAEAELSAREAADLVAAAANEPDEESRNARMTQAARARQRTREANLRARAALLTAQDMEAEELVVRQRALEASKRVADLNATLGADRDEEALKHLVALKQRLDEKAGPNARPDMAEVARRAVGEQERQAARALQQANAKRTEDGELVDRINRLKREREAARNKGRHEELDREITEYEGQLAHLRRETEAAFAKAAVVERETAVMRGKASLTRYLATTGQRVTTSDPDPDQVAVLGQRIAGAEGKAEGLSIDARFDALLANTPAEVEARTFNWDLTSVALLPGSERSTTRTAERDTQGDIRRTSTRGTELSPAELAERRPVEGQVPQVPVSSDDNDRTARNASERSADAATLVQPGNAATDANRSSTRGTEGSPAELAERRPVEVQVPVNNDDVAEVIPTGNDRAPAIRASEQRSAKDPEDRSMDAQESLQRSVAEMDGVQAAIGTEGSDRNAQSGRDQRGAVATVPGQESGSMVADNAATAVLTPEQVRNGTTQGQASTPDASDAVVPGPDGLFLLENEIAELRQLQQIERNKARRDSMEARILTLENRRVQDEAAALAQARSRQEPVDRIRSEAGIHADDLADMSRVPLTIDATTPDEQIRGKLFADYIADHQSLSRLEDAFERADGLYGLELMMADSIRGEMVRQVALLELDPMQAERVLPRLDRLRRLREEHLAMAERHLDEGEAERLAMLALAPAGQRRTTSGQAGDSSEFAAIPDLINDHFVAFAPMREQVYESQLKHRSSKVAEALVAKETDLQRIENLTNAIDSLMQVAQDMPPGRERDRLRREADRLRDDRLIVRTDLGQRTTYLIKEEWSLASDSLKQLERAVLRKGLAQDEPLIGMAQDMKAEAQRRSDQAAELRRKADRSQDILLRDSLYRSAYAAELFALRELDRAIIVNNHLLGSDHVPGGKPAFDVIAARVLGFDGSVAERPQALPYATAVQSDRSDLAVRQESPAEPAEPPPVQNERIPDGTADARAIDATAAPVAMGSENDAQARLALAMARADEAAREDALHAAREAAREQLRQAEAALDPAARAPVKRFDAYLDNEGEFLPMTPMSASGDPKLLEQRARDAGREATVLEAQAQELKILAKERESRAATAKRRERTELERLAMRDNRAADSLLVAAELMHVASREASEQQQQAEQVLILRGRLMKFYYLSNEEQALVTDDPDRSRFFQAAVRAMELGEAAAEAEAAAQANRDLASRFAEEAAAVRRTSPENGTDAERARLISERASALVTKADSLDEMGARLRRASSGSGDQAGLLLKEMSQEDASRLMDLELGARRTVGLAIGSRNRPDGTVADVGVVSPQDPGIVSVPPTAAMPPLTAPLPARIPEVLTTDLFILRPTGDRAGTEIPVDQEMPSGIVYTVQVGAFRNAIPAGTFGDLAPVMAERLDNGLTRYKAGLFTNVKTANAARDVVRGRGYGDAFVVVYRNGQRISISEAQREQMEAGLLARVDPLSTNPASSRTLEAALARQDQQVAPGGSGEGGAGQPPGTTFAGSRPGETSRQQAATTARSDGAAGNAASAAVDRPQGMDQTIAQPTPVRPPEQEAAAVLANYPSSAAKIVESFTPEPARAAYYNDPMAAPARQVETVKGLFFTVQVGVYSKPVALDKLFNISPLNSELTETSKIRYTTGIYLNEDQARMRRDQAVVLGVRDAFITAYLNGARIPMRDARLLLAKYGPDILARP